MISIIICSKQPKVSDTLIANVEKLIDFDFEWIVIDNSKNQFSIFQVYQKGIEQSKGDYWCFMHDDILFHTKSWGAKLVNLMHENLTIGLVGVAGATFKSKAPSAWWDCSIEKQVFHVLQHQPIQSGPTLMSNGFQTSDAVVKVAVMDGVFMFAKKDTRLKWDTNLKGFHQYDLYLSAVYHRLGYDIVVTNQILIEHFSSGVINPSWYKTSLKFHQKYVHYLPIKVSKTRYALSSEINQFKKFGNELLEKNFPWLAFQYFLYLLKHSSNKKYPFQFLKRLLINICKKNLGYFVIIF